MTALKISRSELVRREETQAIRRDALADMFDACLDTLAALAEKIDGLVERVALLEEGVER